MSENIAVVGAGYMGGGIAATFALSGNRVMLADATAELATASRERLITEAIRFVVEGLYPESAPTMIAERIDAVASIQEAVSNASFVAEAVSERPDIKAGVLATVSDAASDKAIITSNTSAISIQELAEFVSHPERFLGVHWMNPAPFVPGVEVIPGPCTSNEVLEQVKILITEIGKVPVTVPDTPGFIANRLQYVLHREASRLIEAGYVTADELDSVVSNSFGFRLAIFGPMAIADMAGLDVYRDTYATLAKSLGNEFTAPAYISELLDQGKFGVKQGGGLTSVGHADPDDLANYRNAAYQKLSLLKSQLGAAPGPKEECR